MLDLLVKNGYLVCPDGIKQASLAVKDGKIVDYDGTGSSTDVKNIVDAKGCYILPGAIDDHVHFNDPGYTWRDDFPHASCAAARGGITTVIDMPMQNLPAVSTAQILQKKVAYLSGRSFVDFALWGALIRTNRPHLKGLSEAGAAAFKCFMSEPSDDYTALWPREIADRLRLLRPLGALAGFHCEDYHLLKSGERACLQAGKKSRKDVLDVHSVMAEKRAVQELIGILRQTGGRVHICHVSHPDVAAVIKRAQQQGLHVTAETCLHYLVLTDQAYLKRGPLFKCAPPLRSKAASQALWRYIEDGTISTIASDHSPCKLEEKDESGPKGAFGAWGGLSGVQTTLQGFWNLAVHEHEASPLLVAKVLAENPAKIFGLWGRKGALLPGFDADFVLLDAQRDWEIKAKQLEYLNKFSAFVGLTGQGLPVATYLRGQCIYEDGSFPAAPQGKFVLAKGHPVV